MRAYCCEPFSLVKYFCLYLKVSLKNGVYADKTPLRFLHLWVYTLKIQSLQTNCLSVVDKYNFTPCLGYFIICGTSLGRPSIRSTKNLKVYLKALPQGLKVQIFHENINIPDINIMLINIINKSYK